MPLSLLSAVKVFLSHPLFTLRVMEAKPSTDTPEIEPVETEEPLLDPVAYLRSLGIEAELMAVVPPIAPAA